MFKNLIIIALIAGLFAGCRHDQTQKQSVSQFHDAQQQVQTVADKAKPHIISFVDDVLQPAIDNVKRDASAMNANAKRSQPAHQAGDTGEAVQVVVTAQGNTNAKYCYSTGYRDNVECYSSPR